VLSVPARDDTWSRHVQNHYAAASMTRKRRRGVSMLILRIQLDPKASQIVVSGWHLVEGTVVLARLPAILIRLFRSRSTLRQFMA
jgi:hypothetical protein